MGFGENTKVSLSASLAACWSNHLITDTTTVDYILIIKTDVDHTPNPNEVRDSKFVSKDELQTMFKNEDLKFTPWFKLICESMLYKWWENLDEGLDKYTGEKEIRRM